MLFRSRQCSKALLSCRVPNRELDALALHVDVFHLEVDPDCGLNVVIKTVVRKAEQHRRLFVWHTNKEKSSKTNITVSNKHRPNEARSTNQGVQKAAESKTTPKRRPTTHLANRGITNDQHLEEIIVRKGLGWRWGWWSCHGS